MSSSIEERILALYGREEVKRDPGLQRMRVALGELVPELSQKIILTVAGTNGKGETTLWLTEEFKARRFCAWISPHVERLSERFVDETGEIDEALLAGLVDECHRECQNRGLGLSYYEFLFFVFCHWARRKNPELLFLEVGLGGRLDAVNVFDARMVLLPSVSRDHQEILGNRYDLILKEKLGLLRPGGLLVSYLGLQYLRERGQEICSSVGARMIDLSEFVDMPKWEFSRRNQLLARAASVLVEKGESALGEEMSNFHSEERFFENRGGVWKARGEWTFYGSHNPDGLRNLIQFLLSGNYTFPRPIFGAVLVAFSRRDPRDIRGMLKMLRGANLGRVLVTAFPHPKALAVDVIEDLAAREGLDFVRDPEDFIKNISPGSRCLVTGSYYFLGHVRSLLRRG